MAALHPLLLLTSFLTIASLPSSAAPAPSTPAPTPVVPPTASPTKPSTPTTPVPSNLTAIMSKKGCKSFAGLLDSNPNVLATFEGVITGGLTVFCPSDQAVSAFMPHYKNLTADGKTSLLLYHGIPVYNSLSTLKTNNDVLNTLATDGPTKSFNMTVQDDGDHVTLKTGVGTVKITSTAFDDHQYLAVFTISDVLQPRELFKVDEPPAPAPAPAAPATKKKKTKKAAAPPPADSPDSAPADQKAADDSSGIAWSVTALQWVVAAVAGIVMA